MPHFASQRGRESYREKQNKRRRRRRRQVAPLETREEEWNLILMPVTLTGKADELTLYLWFLLLWALVFCQWAEQLIVKIHTYLFCHHVHPLKRLDRLIVSDSDTTWPLRTSVKQDLYRTLAVFWFGGGKKAWLGLRSINSATYKSWVFRFPFLNDEYRPPPPGGLESHCLSQLQNMEGILCNVFKRSFLGRDDIRRRDSRPSLVFFEVSLVCLTVKNAHPTFSLWSKGPMKNVESVHELPYM